MKEIVFYARKIHKIFKNFYGTNIKVNFISDNALIRLNFPPIISGGLKKEYKFSSDSCSKDCKSAYSDYYRLFLEVNTIQSEEFKIIFNKEELLSKRIMKIDIFYRNNHDLYNLFAELKTLSYPYNNYVLKEPVELEMLVPPDDKSNPNYKKYMRQYWKNMNELYAEK